MDAISDIKGLEDYFLRANERKPGATYCCVIQGYSDDIGAFLNKYYMETQKHGCAIKGPLKNPDENNISFLHEKTGNIFNTDKEFLRKTIQKLIPNMAIQRKELLSTAMEDLFSNMKKTGKHRIWLKTST